MKKYFRIMNKTNKGFTLFELLVSISIIGILVAIASFSYSTAQRKARDARRVQDIGSIQKSAEQYYSLSNSSYPLSAGALVGANYFSIYPTDPKGTGSYVYTLVKVGGGALDGTDYCACALLENTTSGNSTNTTCNGFVAGSAYYCVRNQQ